MSALCDPATETLFRLLSEIVAAKDNSADTIFRILIEAYFRCDIGALLAFEGYVVGTQLAPAIKLIKSQKVFFGAGFYWFGLPLARTNQPLSIFAHTIFHILRESRRNYFYKLADDFVLLSRLSYRRDRANILFKKLLDIDGNYHVDRVLALVRERQKYAQAAGQKWYDDLIM